MSYGNLLDRDFFAYLLLQAELGREFMNATRDGPVRTRSV